jgi:tetratricopeptide (TPR) repeat protein
MSKKPRLHLDDYLYSTYASIRLSYSQLDDSSRVLLHLFCLLHASNISLKIFKTAAKYQYRSRAEWEILPRDEKHAERLGILQKMFISDGKWATVHVDELLIHLKSFSLASLSCSKGTRTITIHPLVQSCIRDTLPKEELEYYLHMAMQVLNSCSRPEEAPLIQELTSHTAVLESIGVDMHANDIAAIGYIIFANGGFEGAIEKWEQVRRECQRQIGDEASLTLRVSHWIGDSLRRIHRYKEAEELVRGVAEAQKRTLGETDRETLWSHELLGRILSNQFKTEEAEAIFRRVLALDEKVFGKENCRTLSIHISLAVVSARQGKYAEAEEIIKHILPVIKANLGEKDVLTLDTSRKLAGILIRQEKWEEAKAIAEEFVEKSQEVYGKTHTNTLNYSACLAVSLRGSGNYKEAERIQKEVLPVQEKKLGPNHADTVKTRDQLETTSRMIEQMDKKGNLTAIPEDPASDLSDAPNLPHLHLSLSTRLRPVVSTGAISPAIPTHSPFGFDYLLNRSQRGSRSSSSTHTGSHGSPRPTPGQLKRFWTVLTSRRR